MPSCRHSRCDGNEPPSTRENVTCDGCDGIRGCRHNGSQKASGPVDSRHASDAVTGDAGRTFEISSAGGEITVRFPTERPVLIRGAARVLLGILVQLTNVEELDEAGEGVRRDS
jgi:hypothetical protein